MSIRFNSIHYVFDWTRFGLLYEISNSIGFDSYYEQATLILEFAHPFLHDRLLTNGFACADISI